MHRAAALLAALLPLILAAQQSAAQDPAQSQRITRAPGADDVVGPYMIVTNTAPTGGANGQRYDYRSSTSGSGQFDIADTVVALHGGLQDGASGLADWRVNLSPTSTAASWSTELAEYNPVNQADDLGWAADPATLRRWVGGPRAVPEAETFGVGLKGAGRNTLYDWSCAASGGPNSLGLRVKAYNCLLGEPDAIGPAGYFLYATGRSAERDDPPQAVLGAAGRWRSGVDLTAATFVTGLALRLGPDQAIGWTSGPQQASIGAHGSAGGLDVVLSPAGTGSVVATAPVQFPSVPYADLPATGAAGRQVLCADCRKPGEPPGAGSGMMVFDDGHARWVSLAGTVAAQ